MCIFVLLLIFQSLLPPPLTVAQLRALAALKETQSQLPGAALPTPGTAVAPVPAPPAAPEAPEAPEEAVVEHGRAGMKVVQGYTPGSAAPNAGAALTQKCPICNQQIPVAEMEQHMKVRIARIVVSCWSNFFFLSRLRQ
jgi:hypothetical protein